MNVFGYATQTEGLLTLQEATIYANAKEVKKISQFLAECAQEMEQDPTWDHRHYNADSGADIIVALQKRKKRVISSKKPK